MCIVGESFICECDLISALDLDFLISACAYIVDVCAVAAVLVDHISVSASVHDDSVCTADCCVIGNAVVNSASLTTDRESLFIDGNLLACADSCQCAVIRAENCCLIAAAAQNGCLIAAASENGSSYAAAIVDRGAAGATGGTGGV